MRCAAPSVMPTCGGDVAKACSRVSRHAEQHVRMVGQERPVGHGIIIIAP